jgi:hypothetical protein
MERALSEEEMKVTSPYVLRPLRPISEIERQRAKRLAASNAIHPPRTRLRELHWPTVALWTVIASLWLGILVAFFRAMTP